MHTYTHTHIVLHLLQIIQCWPALTPVFNSNKYVAIFFKFHSFPIVSFRTHILLVVSYHQHTHKHWGISLCSVTVTVLFDFRYSFWEFAFRSNKSNRIDSISFSKKKLIPSPLIYFIYSDWHVFRVCVGVCCCMSLCVSLRMFVPIITIQA